MRSWPAYICNARAEHDCDAILLVLALSKRAARESAGLIRTGTPALTWPRWSAAPAPCRILAIRCTVRS